MNLNRELKWICDLLTKNGIKFWIDSGTLLGLVREGRVIEGDHDIDLSMWSSNEPLLEKILPAVKNRGYSISVKSYRGLNFKYKFAPKFKNSSLVIDISLFRPEGDHAWCPQVYCMPYPFAANHKGPAYYLRALPRKMIQEIFIRKSKVTVTNWPWPLSYKIYIVWIPKKYFEETIHLDGNIPAPKNYEDYLAFRYGQWEIPRDDWFFIFDDGAIKQVSPETKVQI